MSGPGQFYYDKKWNLFEAGVNHPVLQ